MAIRKLRFPFLRAIEPVAVVLSLLFNHVLIANAYADASSSKFESNLPKSTNDHEHDVDFDVVICGGGIVGLSTAVALARQFQLLSHDHEENTNIRIKVFEQAASLKPAGALFGLFPNGVAALQSICPDMCQKVLDSAIQVKGMMHKNVRDGIVVDTNVRESTGVNNNNGRFLVWYLLQRHLADALPDGVLCLGKEFKSYEIDDQTGLVRVTLSDRESTSTSSNGKPIYMTCRVLIGADGIKSTVRKILLGKETKLHYHKRMMYRGVLKKAKIDESLCECPPRGYRVSYTCGEVGKGFLFGESARGILTITATVITDVPIESASSSDEIKARMREIFNDYPPEVHHVIDYMDGSAIYENAVYDIDMLHDDGWSDKSVVIIGDAAHAMSPALGQGGNIGLEDSAELALSLAPVLRDVLSAESDGHIKQQQEQIANALKEYWQRRFPRVEEVHRMSREQAVSRNKGISKSEFQKGKEDFYKRLYGWKPVTGTTGRGD